MSNKLLTVSEVTQTIGVATSTLYRWMHNGNFPRGIKLGPACTRWRSIEIEQWIQNCPRALEETREKEHARESVCLS